MPLSHIRYFLESMLRNCEHTKRDVQVTRRLFYLEYLQVWVEQGGGGSPFGCWLVEPCTVLDTHDTAAHDTHTTTSQDTTTPHTTAHGRNK